MEPCPESRSVLPFTWPSPPLNVVLVEPDIPQNTGNIARLCAATGSPLHLVGPLGFHITSSKLKRAGLDYWESVNLIRHTGWEEYERGESRVESREGHAPRTWFFSTKGKRSYTDVEYRPGDALVFGCETRGLPVALLERYADQVLTVPMQVEHVRSLNLANTVSIVLYEALRQLNLTGGKLHH
jgi:tRNA (cytidine/uridine-2'-O-)-methyltransferase